MTPIWRASRRRADRRISKDGETFLMLRDPGQQRRRIVVTFNWVTELQAKVPR
jgi:hypothetical protein